MPMVAQVRSSLGADGSGSEKKPDQGNVMVVLDQAEAVDKVFFRQLKQVTQILSDSQGGL